MVLKFCIGSFVGGLFCCAGNGVAVREAENLRSELDRMQTRQLAIEECKRESVSFEKSANSTIATLKAELVVARKSAKFRIRRNLRLEKRKETEFAIEELREELESTVVKHSDCFQALRQEIECLQKNVRDFEHASD